MKPDLSCPCGSPKSYAECCGPLHGGGDAVTAEALMRSRYSAYALGDKDYLLRTWAESTRPTALAAASPRWLGLKVVRYREHGDEAEVEFVARFRQGGKVQLLHETSRFVREGGRWFYIDGVFV